MSLLSIAECRDKVQTSLSDAKLQVVIDNEEAEIVRRYGANYDGTTTVTEVVSGGGCDIFLKRPVLSITSITEATSLGATATTLASTAYYLWASQGRITRLAEGTAWSRQVTVVYVPADDSAKRKQVTVELVRLALEQTAMQAESVAGEYSYTAPDWEAKRVRLYKRLEFPTI
jgi:hypothetical protein